MKDLATEQNPQGTLSELESVLAQSSATTITATHMNVGENGDCMFPREALALSEMDADDLLPPDHRILEDHLGSMMLSNEGIGPATGRSLTLKKIKIF